MMTEAIMEEMIEVITEDRGQIILIGGTRITTTNGIGETIIDLTSERTVRTELGDLAWLVENMTSLMRIFYVRYGQYEAALFIC